MKDKYNQNQTTVLQIRTGLPLQRKRAGYSLEWDTGASGRQGILFTDLSNSCMGVCFVRFVRVHTEDLCTFSVYRMVYTFEKFSAFILIYSLHLNNLLFQLSVALPPEALSQIPRLFYLSSPCCVLEVPHCSPVLTTYHM